MRDGARIVELVDLARRAALNARRAEAALGAGTVLGRILWQNQIGPLGDEPLEFALHERHGSSLANGAVSARVDMPPVDWLHVISEAYDSGGHTQLLESLLALQVPQQTVGVAVTVSHTQRFVARCAELGVTVHALQGRLCERATGLIALGRRAKRIMLHIHPDDLGSAIAARILRAEGRMVVFLNHADHVFGFGHGAANVVAEVSGFGWRLTSERRTAQAQHFLGIPMPPLPSKLDPEMTAKAVAEGSILSIGSAYKYRPDGDQDFQSFLMTLMSRTERQVEIIGPHPEDPCWQGLLACHGARLRLLGTLSFEETLARLAGAACYVDSFPITGGTALPQGLMAGKAVFAPPYSAGGYTLADALRAPSIETMTEQILEFLATGNEPATQAGIRGRIAAEFGTKALNHRLTCLEQGAWGRPPNEMLAAAKDIDYFTNAWQRCGPQILTFSPLACPGLETRIQLTSRMAGQTEFHRPAIHSLLRWALLGPRARWAASP